MSESGQGQVDQHAADEHAGFPSADTDFEAVRAERGRLVEQFLAAMDKAGNPGLTRAPGSAIRQLTGQEPDEHWAAVLDVDGDEREVLVFTDGRHGWSDELTYSDRPRNVNDEIRPEQLRTVLRGLLDAHRVSRVETGL
jgi:hypothetical protein